MNGDKTMTRKELAEAIHQKMGFPKRMAAQLVDAFFDSVKNSLLAGDSVKIVRFGTFNLRHKSPRMGRNPQTGEAMEICRRSMVSFKACKSLREKLNREP